MFNGTTRFSDFQLRLNIAPNIVALRLSSFVDSGLMELRQADEDRSLHEYILTKKGMDLAPAVIALAKWGSQWTSQEDPPLELEHNGIGGTLELLIRCTSCGERPSTGALEKSSSLDSEVLNAALTELPNNQPNVDAPLPPIHVTLLGGFAISIDGQVVSPLASGTQRLLAYVALHDDSVTRISMAGTMWPEVSDQNAGGSLRSALSRLDPATRDALFMAPGEISLEDSVLVDFREARSLAHRLLEYQSHVDDSDLSETAVALLSQDLLPGWYEDWVVAEAEDWRVLRRNALEAQAGFLSEQDRWTEAAGAARLAIAVDPLRESPQACLVKVHLARGNRADALAVFDTYRELLMTEVGIEPSNHMKTLIVGLRPYSCVLAFLRSCAVVLPG